MNNEPVAWMNKEKNAVVTKPFDLWGNPALDYTIPLYTRPSKQLNDSAFYMSDEQHIKNLQSSLKEKLERIAELENRERFIQNFAEEQHKRACDLENKPSKQLSDEEIANIWAEHTKIAGTYDVKDIIFPFARAIIKEITE